MHRFTIKVEGALQEELCLSQEESRHALSVLRIKIGEVVELLDGQGRCFRGVASKIAERRLWVQIDKNAVSNTAESLALRITLAVSVIKPEKMDIIFQKCCELGVEQIIPLITDRSIVKLSKERWDSKIERWKKIVAESCKQCGRATPMRVQPALKLQALEAEAKQYDKIFIPTLAVKGEAFHSALSRVQAQNVLVLIGPEGDFSVEEARWAMDHGAIPISLGSLILRTETAAVYISSVLNYLSGQLSGNKLC